MRIKDTVDKMPGVEDVRVSVSSKEVHVSYDAARVSDDQILQKIKSLGYKAQVLK